MKHLVICGGGFAGVRLARKLKNKKDITISLINDSPYFRYYPAMYRAAAGFKMASARIPLEWMLIDHPRLSLYQDKVSGVDPVHKVITTASGGQLSYDYAVFALGSETTYFNIEGIPEHSYGMKSPDEVTELRQHLHNSITSNREADENYVIAGAGPAGVELAGGLGKYIKKIAKKHKAKNHKVRVYLVEAGPRILPMLSERNAKAVQRRLEKRGVKILTGTAVTRETASQLRTSHGTIKSHTVIWTAGTMNNRFFAAHPQQFELNKRGRVIVNNHLQTKDGLYVIGDNAATPHAGLALTAVEHANFIAKDIKARMHNKPRPKKYEKEPIVVVPIDDSWAALQYKQLALHGWVIAQVRRAADFIGYSDVLGHIKALSIWSNGEKTENNCSTCDKS